MDRAGSVREPARATSDHPIRAANELIWLRPQTSNAFVGAIDSVAVGGNRGWNFSTEPATILGPVSSVPVISTGVGGPAAVILAHFATGGGWASEIVMANVASTAIIVRVDLFAADGTPLSATLNGKTGSSFVNIEIPAGGVATLAPLDSEGDSDF